MKTMRASIAAALIGAACYGITVTGALAQQPPGVMADPGIVSSDQLVVGAPQVTMAPKSTEEFHNDYPTVARADYVFACMQVNGQTRETLERCSCSIDVIASLLPYTQYEEAETIMSVRQRGGESTSMFLSHAPLREKVNELKRAQVEGELRCF